MNETQIIGVYFENGWISLWIQNIMEFDIHLGALAGIALIIAGVVLFKRTRRRVKLDRNVGLLGVVTPREPFRH